MKFNWKSGLMILLIVGLVAGWGIIAKAVQTGGQNGSVDWKRGVITVSGEGAPPGSPVNEAQAKLMAKRAARTVAYRNAVEFIEGVQVDSQTKVKNMVTQSDRIEAQVNGYVKQAQVTKVEYGPAGLCKVTLEVPLGAQNGQEGLTSFLETSVQEDTSDQRVENIDDYLEQDRPAGQTESERDPEEQVGSEQPPTGVVIDARGHQVKPALYPQVFDSEGYPIYGPTKVSADAPQASSMVAYARDKEEALEIDRLGENPVVVEAVSVLDKSGEAPTDLILDSEAAGRFRALDEKQGIINRRAVVFLID